MPRVSVVIPTFNRIPLLRRAVQSVLAQTFVEVEIIIIQNGPVEHAKPFYEEISQQNNSIRYIYEPKTGGANARNKGVVAAKGEYVAFLDDDDEWLPEKLKRQVEFLDQHPEVGLVSCSGWRVNERDEVLGEVHKNQGPVSFQSLLRNCGEIISLSSVMVRKKCFSAVGFFNTSYEVANDYEFYLRLVKTYEIALLAEPLFRYRWHSKRASWDVIKMFREVREIAQSYADQSSEVQDQKSNLKRVNYKSAQYYYFLASEAFQFKNYGSAAWFYCRAVIYDPLVGDRMVKWSYFQNWFYRIVRPYLAVVASSFLFIFYSVIEKVREMLFVRKRRMEEIKTK